MDRAEFQDNVVEFIGLPALRAQSADAESVGAEPSGPHRLLAMVDVASEFQPNVAERIVPWLVHSRRSKCEHHLGTIVRQRLGEVVFPQAIHGMA